MTNPTIRRRAQPKLTTIPIDLSRRSRRAIEVMAVRNGLSFEQQIVTLVCTHPAI